MKEKGSEIGSNHLSIISISTSTVIKLIADNNCKFMLFHSNSKNIESTQGINVE